MADKENTLPVEITTPVPSSGVAMNEPAMLTEAELDAVSGGISAGAGANWTNNPEAYALVFFDFNRAD